MGNSQRAIYAEPGFLDRLACRRIVQAMNAGVADEAEVLEEGFETNDAIRRALSIDIAPDILAGIEAALDGRRKRLEDFFGLRLSTREGAGFLRYPEGGFYAPHVDCADVESWPAAARRALAVVVFLNGSREAGPDGAFSGGVLRLYDGTATIDVLPRTGLLVAFRADLLHEVTAVVGGIRDAIVDWFYGGP